MKSQKIHCRRAKRGGGWKLAGCVLTLTKTLSLPQLTLGRVVFEQSWRELQHSSLCPSFSNIFKALKTVGYSSFWQLAICCRLTSVHSLPRYPVACVDLREFEALMKDLWYFGIFKRHTERGELKELLSVPAKPTSYSQSRDTVSLIGYCLSITQSRSQCTKKQCGWKAHHCKVHTQLDLESWEL